jgi:hypothetical protein
MVATGIGAVVASSGGAGVATAALVGPTAWPTTATLELNPCPSAEPIAESEMMAKISSSMRTQRRRIENRKLKIEN